MYGSQSFIFVRRIEDIHTTPIKTLAPCLSCMIRIYLPHVRIASQLPHIRLRASHSVCWGTQCVSNSALIAPGSVGCNPEKPFLLVLMYPWEMMEFTSLNHAWSSCACTYLKLRINNVSKADIETSCSWWSFHFVHNQPSNQRMDLTRPIVFLSFNRTLIFNMGFYDWGFECLLIAHIIGSLLLRFCLLCIFVTARLQIYKRYLRPLHKRFNGGEVIGVIAAGMAVMQGFPRFLNPRTFFLS